MRLQKPVVRCPLAGGDSRPRLSTSSILLNAPFFWRVLDGLVRGITLTEPAIQLLLMGIAGARNQLHLELCWTAA